MERTVKVLFILLIAGILENTFSNTTYIANAGVIYIVLVLVLNWKKLKKELF